MKTIFKLLRVKHYVKNILIFIPFVFGTTMNLMRVENMLIAFVAFSFMASSIYIINDLKDIEKDRLHPKKKDRPIASGKVSKKVAAIVAGVMFVLSIMLNYFAASSWLSYMWLIVYFVLNLVYSMKLKNVPVIDIAILVGFYVIRVYYGAAVAEIPVSNWLYLTILAGASFLAFSKRRNELKIKGSEARNVLKFYTLDFLDKFMYICLALTIAFYSLWAAEQSNKCFVYTIPFILLICIRYCLVVETTDNDDPVEIVLKDKMLLGFEILFVLFGLGILIFNICA